MRRVRVLFAVAAAFFAAGMAAWADEAPVFHPQVSDLMSETQLRHFKLWFSGSLKNWPLAKFEMGKMRTSFDLAAEFGGKTYPKFSELVKQEFDPAFQALDLAISKGTRRPSSRGSKA